MVRCPAWSLCGGGVDSNSTVLASAELYDPITGVWSYTGSMTIARYCDNPSPTTLPDGSVLIVGGTDLLSYHWFNEAEIIRFGKPDVDTNE